MNFFRLLPVVISALLLAAHFFRAGQDILVLFTLGLLLLLFLRKRWVPIVITAALVLGAFEWLYTLTRIATFRAEMGAPWTRMALILGCVALFTLISALVFRLEPVKRRYAGAPRE